jgi:hypothetical protein
LVQCRLKVPAWARKESMQLSADDISASHTRHFGVPWSEWFCGFALFWLWAGW